MTGEKCMSTRTYIENNSRILVRVYSGNCPRGLDYKQRKVCERSNFDKSVHNRLIVGDT